MPYLGYKIKINMQINIYINSISDLIMAKNKKY